MLITPVYANMLEQVKSSDTIHCGTNADGLGFGAPGKDGTHTGMGVDLCRVIAKAVLGDSNKARAYAVLSRDRLAFTAVGNYQVTISTLEWTMYRESFLGVKFVSPWFYDVQRIATKKSDNVKSIKDLNGATVCVTQGANTEISLGDMARIHGIKVQPIVFGDPNQTTIGFHTGRCDAYSVDGYLMAGQLLKVQMSLDDVIIFDVDNNVKTYGALLKAGEPEWENAVRWIINTLIHAEALGVNKANVDEMAKNSTNPEVRRLLQVEGDFYKRLGLRQSFAIDIIKEFGNYGEIYNKHFGPNNIHGVVFPPRTYNKICKDGGRICVPPIY